MATAAMTNTETAEMTTNTTETVLMGRAAEFVAGYAARSDADALCELFAVIRRIAEQQLARLRTLEVQVCRVLPRETNTTMNLDVFCSGVEVRLRAIRL